MPDLLAVIPFPDFDPVALDLGVLQIRWYALSYIAGLVFAWLYLRRIVHQRSVRALGENFADASEEDIRRAAIMSRRDVDDFLFWAVIGVVLGGRLGYVLFYKPAYFIQNPLEIFALWGGGMAFHGGLVGVILVAVLFARQRGLRIASLFDLMAIPAPVGLFLGRLANFINGELWGRATDVSWAMVFPNDPSKLPRHPSQLYEALLEGVVLFLVLWIMRTRFRALDRPGELGGLFLLGYGLARFMVEFVREPDAHLGLLLFDMSMGQLLSLPLILFGVWMIWRARRHAATPTPA